MRIPRTQEGLHVLHLASWIPLPSTICADDVEMPEQMTQNQAHFHVRQAKRAELLAATLDACE